MDQFGGVIQECAEIAEPLKLVATHRVVRLERRREAVVERLYDLAAAGPLAVEHEAVLVKAGRGEALVDDVERGGLLGDEQHPLALADALRDDVGDRLALAGPRWPLHHERLAALRRLDAYALAGIGVEDRQRRVGGLDVV